MPNVTRTPPPPPDAVQVPTHEQACNAPHAARAGEIAGDYAGAEPALREFVPLLRRLQPNASLSRRGVTGWAAASVPSGHCLHRGSVERLEAALRGAARPAHFGADEAQWRRFATRPFEMYRDTAALHLVEPSDGVHVAPGVNAVFAHVLATHLLGVMRAGARAAGDDVGFSSTAGNLL